MITGFTMHVTKADGCFDFTGTVEVDDEGFTRDMLIAMADGLERHGFGSDITLETKIEERI